MRSSDWSSDVCSSDLVSAEEIARCEADPAGDLKLLTPAVPVQRQKTKGAKYTPLSKRQDRPDAIAMLAEPDKQVRCRATRRARPKRITAQGFASRDQHLDKRGQCDPPFRECLLKRTQGRLTGRPPTRQRQQLLAIKPVRALESGALRQVRGDPVQPRAEARRGGQER